MEHISSKANYKPDAGTQYGDLFSYTKVDGGYGVTGFHGRNKETIIFSNDMRRFQ